MNPRLALLRLGVPRLLRAAVLDELTRRIARAFAAQPPEWGRMAYRERLSAFAQFSAMRAERLLATADEERAEAVRARLCASSALLGGRLRRQLRLRRWEEVAPTLCLLYHHIGIEMREGTPGELIVIRCAFSDRYSEQVCRFISALDEGMAAGLSGGGNLAFDRRITAGDGFCRATLQPPGAAPHRQP